MKKMWTVVMLSVLVVGLAGCTVTEQHTGAGAATGAALGALATGDARGAALGGIAGGVIGNVHGQNVEARQRTDAQMRQLQAQANQTTVWITNSNGSKTPVTLNKIAGGQWQGPRGEVYNNLPTEDQLRSIYGF